MSILQPGDLSNPNGHALPAFGTQMDQTAAHGKVEKRRETWDAYFKEPLSEGYHRGLCTSHVLPSD